MSNNMQNQWDDEEDFDFDETPTRDDGNDLVRQLRKADRAKEKRIKEMEAELQSLRSMRRESTISQVLTSEGVNPKIAKFIPADVTEPDAVKAWLDENADALQIQRSSEEQGPAIPAADMAALRNMDAVTANALSPHQVDDLYNRLNQAQSEDEVLSLIFGRQ